MGGFMGIGNSSAKTDRGRALGGWQAEWEQLAKGRDTFGKLFPQAQTGFQTGTNTMGAGADFLKNILGSRTEAAAAMAPESNAVAQQADALRQAQAQLGTSRGGGVSGTNQQTNQAVQNQIANQMFAQRTAAAPAAVSAGSQQASVAAQQLAAALQAMGMSNELAQHIVQSSMQSRIQSNALNRQTQGDWTGLASRLLGVAGVG